MESNIEKSNIQSWKDVHEDFDGYYGEENKNLWKNHDFNYQATKEWTEVLGKNFAVSDWSFCAWLRDKKHLTSQEAQQQGNLKSLRTEYNKLWTDIHEEFAEKDDDHFRNKTYQQYWEENGLTYQDAKEWITVEFEPENYKQVNQWKSYNFVPWQVKVWREAGLKISDYEFATYLRGEGHRPNPDLNLEQLREGFNVWLKKNKSAQEYLDTVYPQEQRKGITNLNVSKKKLTGSLDLRDFVSLEKLNCSWNQLSDLNLSDCNQLKYLECHNNYLQDLKLPSRAEKLTTLDVSNNNLSERDLSMFSHLVNLESLEAGNKVIMDQSEQVKIEQGTYNRFHGSLEPLKNLSKLEFLAIDNTDINSGVEHLPSGLSGGKGEISYSTQERPQSKIKEIAWYLDLFTRGTQIKWEELNFTLEEIRQWIKAGLTADDYGFAYYLKKEKNSNSAEEIKDELDELRREYETLSWKDIHLEFTPELKNEWEDKGFTHAQTEEWAGGRWGLKPQEGSLAKYLQSKEITPEEAWQYIDKLREEYSNLNEKKTEGAFSGEVAETGDWEDIDLEFKRYQKEWEEEFDYQQAKKWIDKGLKPWDSKLASEFTAYFKTQEQPLLTSDLVKMHRKYSNLQTYLDFWYPPERKKQITKLDINFKGLKGDLIIDGKEWKSLEEIDCSSNNFPSITLNNLPKLKIFNAGYCKLQNLTINGCPQLQNIDVNYNSFTDLEFLNNVNPENLVYLDVARNRLLNQDLSAFGEFENLETLMLGWKADGVKSSNLWGSLEPLKNLTKLKSLDISNTDIDSGLEFLPQSLEFFYARPSEDCACIKIDQELQEVDFSTWREFNSPAKKWLDENYPEGKRKNLTKLNINGKKLKGGLRLRDFVNLKKLDCSDNQLTNLDLRDCHNLLELKCSDNDLHDLNFLRDPIKLKKILIQNNKKLSGKNLGALVRLKKLEYLDISNCPLEGSLNPLEGLDKLKKINISHTNISEGLEYLPESCKKLYCDLDYGSKTTEIIKKFNRSMKEANNLYILDRWREDQSNNKTASAIPLERLFVIRGNLKQFINKWEKESDNNLFEKLYYWKAPANDSNDLAKLQSPEQYSKYWNLTTGIQWINRAASVTGGGLLLINADEYAKIGGTIAIASPFVETVTSYLDDKIYSVKETKWNEFLVDADTFSDSFNELSGMTKAIKFDPELGEVNKEFGNLKNKVENFLDDYDEDGNQEIDLGELTDEENRAILARDLAKRQKGESKLQEIIDIMKQLEKKVIAYRQGEKVEGENISTEPESQEEILKQQIREKVKKIKEQKAKQKNALEVQLSVYQQIKNQLNEERDTLSFLEESKQLTNKESKLLNNKIEKLKKDLSEVKKKIDEIKKEQRKEISSANNEEEIVDDSGQTESQPEIVVDSNEHFETNQSLNNSQANLLDKSKNKDIEMQNLGNEQSAQIQQVELPYGTPSSSK